MAILLKDVYDIYQGDSTQLTPAKNNTPFGYYDNDPEWNNKWDTFFNINNIDFK